MASRLRTARSIPFCSSSIGKSRYYSQLFRVYIKYLLDVFFIRLLSTRQLQHEKQQVRSRTVTKWKEEEGKNERRRRIEEKNCLSGFYYLVYCCQITYDQL